MQYRLFIKTTCPTFGRLYLWKDDFLLGAPNNSFTVGKGDKVDLVNGDIISQLFWDDNDLQNSSYNYGITIYFDDDIWIEIDVSQGFFSFEILYYIGKNKDNIICSLKP